MNPDEVLKAVSARGRATPGELAEAVRHLTQKDDDNYSWLLVIGRARATQHRPIVERFLDSADDPMMARLAIQILCRYWGLGTKYASILERFSRGVSWDTDDDARLMAIDCLGEVLADHCDVDSLRLLLDLYRSPDERQIVREAAYSAMARAMGTPAEQLPSPARHFDLDKDTNPGIIDAVEARIASERSQK